MHVVVAHARAAHVRHVRSFLMRILAAWLRVDAEAFSVLHYVMAPVFHAPDVNKQKHPVIVLVFRRRANLMNTYAPIGNRECKHDVTCCLALLSNLFIP